MPVDPEDIIEIGDTLLKQYPDTFGADFETNKSHVERFTHVESRHVRNRIAGYITRRRAGTTEAGN